MSEHLPPPCIHWALTCLQFSGSKTTDSGRVPSSGLGPVPGGSVTTPPSLSVAPGSVSASSSAPLTAVPNDDGGNRGSACRQANQVKN